ncbi:MAG: hypothetical protein ACREOS_07765, partial [Candidatus Dormibacteraceae bacterium]
FLEVGPARICPGPHWDWRTRPVDPKTNEPHTWMWHIYHVELFPDTPGLRLSGIPGKNGQPQTYAEAFRQTRSFQPRGIIQIIP